MMVRPSWRARFFYGDPVAARPGGDRTPITLPRPGGRALHREAERLQQPLQVARMVVHPELPPDQRRDAPQGPLLGLKTGRHRPRANNRPRRSQAAASRRAGRPVRGRARKPRRPACTSVAAQRHTLAPLTPSCRAMTAWLNRPCHNSAAAARCRSSICSGVMRQARRPPSTITHGHLLADGRWCPDAWCSSCG